MSEIGSTPVIVKKTKTKHHHTLDENWQNFVDICRKRCQAHIYTAWYWNMFHTTLNITITILAGIATLLAVIEQHMPGFVIPLVAGIATLLASINSFLKPAEKYQQHHDSANTFNVLMFKLIRCTVIEEYENIINEIYEARNNEPFLLKQQMIQASQLHHVAWTMTTDLYNAIKADKDGDIHLGDDQGKPYVNIDSDSDVFDTSSESEDENETVT